MDAISEIISQIPTAKQPLAHEYEKEMRFMMKKLEQARECIDDADIVIPYDNGGGQVGIRANPAFAEYEKLFKTWDAAARSLLSMIPDGEKKQPAKVSKLDDLRAQIKLVGSA